MVVFISKLESIFKKKKLSVLPSFSGDSWLLELKLSATLFFNIKNSNQNYIW